ncbi:phage tail protein [Sphingomonas sp. RB3P16]|uniref:phage tail protein n=1 Tax=Parasphingomonas frigoris TaxID=3096163 RepID=UPI002FCC2EE9
MATLVLTAVGRYLGGPIGGAIGAVVGNAIDRDVLFRPADREGPRLSALQVQTSSYATPLQQVFGTMRIGGCVIWSTDLIESRTRSSGGKGQPNTTSYSYAASFAVALSGRPIVGVGRIWADGTLLRGSGGDFKSATGFRLYRGGEDQPVDPLIAAAEGIALAPAHRGIAYAVFENFQLGDYGNRIPSLTFEVIGDAAPVGIAAIATALSDGMVTRGPGADAAGAPLAGYAAYGDSVTSVLAALAQAGGAWFAPDAAGLQLCAGETPAQVVPDGAWHAPGSSGSKPTRSVAAIDGVPRQITLSHYDPARDYQIGVQQARRPGAGRRDNRVDLPAAIAAGTAKTLAQAMLARAEAERERRTVTLGWDALAIRPGACIRIDGVAGVWRVAAWSLEQMVLTLDCVRLAGGTLPARASPGRVLAAPDLAAGATVLAAFETLPLDDDLLAAPRVTIVAAGTQPGWRRAALLYSIDGGARWTALGATATAGTIGQLVTTPGTASGAIADLVHSFEVDLLHGAMALTNADAAALDGGANLARVGAELLQFATAEPLSATRWRLSGLLRGRRATGSAIGTQQVGDRFVLIEPESFLILDVPVAALGGELRLLASGIGDTDGPVELRVALAGGSVLPPAPVHLAWREQGDGGVAVQWVRRSRNGWRWIDRVDAPLGEEREAYRVTLLRGGAVLRVIETTVAALAIARADRVGGLTLRVAQVGALGQSAEAETMIPDWTG